MADAKNNALTSPTNAWRPAPRPECHSARLHATSSYPGAVATRRKLPFDPVAVFVTVAMIARAPFVLAVHPSVPAKTVKEFIAVAKQRTITYSSSGTGGSNHFATAQDGGKFAVEPLDHRGRRARGRTHAVPGQIFKSGHGFRHGGQIGQVFKARLAGGGQRAHAAAFDKRQRARRYIERHLNLPARKSRQQGHCTIIRNMRHGQTRHHAEHRTRSVSEAADAGGGVIEFTGLLPRQRNQILDRMHRHARMQCEDRRHLRHVDNRRDFIAQIVRQLIQIHIHHPRSHRRDQQRVAIGR
jgi:Tripartite tricarboxylate transporter family receptor